jgi:hypothetical protein
VQPAAMALHDPIGQRLRQPVKLLTVGGILKARERGLRSQVRALDRVAPQQQHVHRVGSQPRGVVGIGIPTGEAVNALGQQLFHFMFDLARLPRIDQTGGQGFGQSQTAVGGLEQDRATVRAALALVKLRHHRLRENIGEQQTFCCGIVSQAKASFGHSNNVSTTCLYHRRLSVSLRNANYSD